MSDLVTTHTSTVTEEQIDHLGHMNVRFYAVNAHEATRTVLADLPSWDGREHFVHDVYTRHLKEQLLGARLAVRSAILDSTGAALRLHHELVNRDTDELAATFVHGISPLDEDGRRLPVPDDVLRVATARAIPHPAHAPTRTISLDADLMANTPSLETVQERGLAMRKERLVDAGECDPSGAYRVEMAPLLTWAGEPIDGDNAEFLYESPDGVRMGWASMETRVQMGELPRVGDRIQAFGAMIAIHDKVIHRVHWTYDLDTAALLTAFESVSMAFDIGGRRPMSIPDGYRAKSERTLQTDLAPQALA
jgi:acyl-CoA thioester hydrolase